MAVIEKSYRKLNWRNIYFFLVITTVSVIWAPLYLWKYGISYSELIVAWVYMFFTGLSVTVGYHRLFAHANFKANPFIKFILLFFGVAAFEESALIWASQHRDHHRFVDTDRDPYSIKKGFWYAHIGWLLFWKHPMNFSNVKDLQRSRLVMHQHKYYYVWATVAGVLTPMAIGALTGHILGAFIFAVCVRLTLICHGTFCINSVCHYFGKATYNIYASARDHWFLALLTNGEGYHSFHHRFPVDYRNGVRWYHWDPSKWTISFLARLGWVWDLRTVSSFRILEARLDAENQRLHVGIKKLENHAAYNYLLETIKTKNQKIKECLASWADAATEYQAVLSQEWSKQTQELLASAAKKLSETRAQFKKSYQQWSEFIQLHPFDLQRMVLAAAV